MKNNIIYTPIGCRNALVQSHLSDLDYALNPYYGCEHGCIYCYAPYTLRYKGKKRWGEFVDIKHNIPNILSKELKLKKTGTVGIGTVTDPYQPIEKSYELTKKCLQILSLYDFPVCIQTKSSLITRDVAELKKISNVEIGITITTLNDEIRQKYEPNASSVEERLSTLEVLKNNGLNVWVFLGPVMPYLTDRGDDLAQLVKKISDIGVDMLYFDKLRLKYGMFDNIQAFLSKNYPELIPKYKAIFLLRNNYFKNLEERLTNLCNKHGIKYESYL